MPKRVDHEERRRAIVRATWRMIARKGISSTTMRDIAAEAGYANGALSVYFDSKKDLLLAAFRYVFDATNDRYAVAARGERGVVALRAYLVEMLPLDEERRLEARIVIPFWEQALAHADMYSLYAEAMARWREELVRLLGEAVDDGEVAEDVDLQTVVDELLAVVNGQQVLALLTPSAADPRRQEALVDRLVGGLRRPR